jgi:phosphoglycolate phosphatase
MPASLILFDLDGTLVDSAGDIAAALGATLVEAGAPPLPREQVIGFIGDGATKLIERAFPDAAPDRVAELVARFRRHYADHLHVETRAYPGIEPLLRGLSTSIPLAVLTNKPSDLARPLLHALDLDRYFVAIVGDGDGFARKPDPAAGHWLLTKYAVRADAALVVGDGIPDVRFARALGAPVAAVTWGYVGRERLLAEGPRWIVDSPDELVSVALS